MYHVNSKEHRGWLLSPGSHTETGTCGFALLVSVVVLLGWSSFWFKLFLLNCEFFSPLELQLKSQRKRFQRSNHLSSVLYAQKGNSVIPLPVQVSLLNSLTPQYNCIVFLSVFHGYILNFRCQIKVFEDKEIDDYELGTATALAMWCGSVILLCNFTEP